MWLGAPRTGPIASSSPSIYLSPSHPAFRRSPNQGGTSAGDELLPFVINISERHSLSCNYALRFPHYDITFSLSPHRVTERTGPIKRPLSTNPAKAQTSDPKTKSPRKDPPSKFFAAISRSAHAHRPCRYHFASDETLALRRSQATSYRIPNP